MTTFAFVNNVNTTLAAAITSTTATTMTLSDVSQLPTSIASGSSIAFVLRDAATRLSYEVVYATAISGSTLTIVRGCEGSMAQTWALGDFAFSGVTSGQMASFSAGGGVTSFNTRTGAITLTSADVKTALGYTPYSNAGGTISGNVTCTGIIQSASTFQSAGISATLSAGPASTGVAGTVYLKPQGYASAVGQATVNSTGTLQSNPTAPNPSTGVSTFGSVTKGSYGGGHGMINGSATWGWYVDGSNNLVFGYSATGGALTAVFKITQSGDLVALGTIVGGTAP